MIHLVPTNLKIDFLGKSKPFVLISTIAALLSIAGLATKGLNYGIDFTGGAEVALKVPPDWDIGKLRSSLAEGGLGEANIVQIGEAREHEFLVKVQASADKLNQVSSQVSQVMTK
ncbi:MAG TPA: hypothetical protein VM598_02615 [Bdellovibrionota bacterium]|nr:hypothetical protein [Bdellovibrionota bacterium]